MANNTPQHNPAPATPSVADIEARIKLLQLQRLEREEIELLDQKHSLEASRKAGIDSIRQMMAGQEAKQSGCYHRKENGRTHLAGQKDHSGTWHMICQGCQKHFTGGEVPAGLMPPLDTMGGPH